MSASRRSTEVLVVGAGPAGMAAAIRAAKCGVQVVVVDDNPSPGGQIWRNQQGDGEDRTTAHWFREFQSLPIEPILGAQAISADSKARTVLIEQQDCTFHLEYRKLILATGARELFLPFPGWTLPNAMGVGGLQALVKSGLRIDGKRILTAGSGPLLLAAAAYFRKHGASVSTIAEQAPWSRLATFGLQLSRYPAKLWQAMELRRSLAGVRYRTNCWVEAAEIQDATIVARLRSPSIAWEEECDYLAVAYGFSPNIELASLIGCTVEDGVVRVDELQQTSIPDVYCAGESTGIGGVDLSLVEGEIAGCAATGQRDAARPLLTKRNRLAGFSAVFERAFALRKELRELATEKTIICRCEDVRLGNARRANSWREAKLHTRCGMGPCQGRVCGPIVRFLFGWQPESIRPPLFPARIGSLISPSIDSEERYTNNTCNGAA